MNSTTAATPSANRCAARRPAERRSTLRRTSSDSAAQNIAPKITNARARCAVSRNCETRGSSVSPLFTMYQPIAPCSAPSTKIAASPAR